jgi:hypothetical protein
MKQGRKTRNEIYLRLMHLVIRLFTYRNPRHVQLIGVMLIERKNKKSKRRKKEKKEKI